MPSSLKYVHSLRSLLGGSVLTQLLNLSLTRRFQISQPPTRRQKNFKKSSNNPRDHGTLHPRPSSSYSKDRANELQYNTIRTGIGTSTILTLLLLHTHPSIIMNTLHQQHCLTKPVGSSINMGVSLQRFSRTRSGFKFTSCWKCEHWRIVFWHNILQCPMEGIHGRKVPFAQCQVSGAILLHYASSVTT
jgi:hypothetical protein